MIHEGYAARAIERKGLISDRCQLNRDIKNDNAELKALQLEIAHKGSPHLIKPSEFNLANAILNALNSISSVGEGGTVGLKATSHKDYKYLLQNASSPEEVAKILAEIEDLASEIHFSGGGIVLVSPYDSDFDKERELDERYEKLKQRRKASGRFRISPERLRISSSAKSTTSTGQQQTDDSASGHYASSSNHSRPKGRDYVAELATFLREESKREIVRAFQEFKQAQKTERRFSSSNQSATLPTSELKRPVATSQLESQKPPLCKDLSSFIEDTGKELQSTALGIATLLFADWLPQWNGSP